MSKGWVPKQHGAWAMLVLPYVLGVLHAAGAGALGWAHLSAFVFWMLGYFTFNSASLWLKASARQRPRYVRPLLVYASASAAAGLVTLVLTGPRPLPWALAFAVLLAPALWLASRRKERAVTGGLLTVAAACLMVPVARYLYPSSTDDLPTVLATAALLFWYFFGTVLFVKTNIRERGSRVYLVASVVWHASAVALAVVLAWQGLAGWWWGVVLAVALVRSIVVPPLGLRPIAIGLAEVALCVAILACAIGFG